MTRTIHKSTGVARFRYEDREVPVVVDLARFRGVSGVEEIQLTARPKRPADFDIQLDWLRRGSREALESVGAKEAETLLRRFLCSDLSSQARALESCPFSDPYDDADPCAVSWVGQRPPPPADVVLWSYHVSDPSGLLDKKRSGDTLILRRGGLEHLWTPGVTSLTEDTVAGQTWSILSNYDAFLNARRLSLADNLIRTWLFVRNIEADYAQLVEVRREFFARHGLTPRTHYVASTGIGGAAAAPAAKIALDAYAIGGVLPEQVGYVKALDHMCPTDAYGVTFERGTTVAYRDRRHLFISGTASIDDKGNVLHDGDVGRQLTRTLENIEAVLAQAGATTDDLCVLIAYIRNLGDEQVVRHGITNRFGDVPLALVAAPVCRPAWLVEIEGQAILPASHPELPSF